jgi:hypothetical protein
MRQASQLVQHILHFIQSKRSPQVERIIGITLLATSLFFLSRTMIQGWGYLKPHLSEISFIPLIAGQLCTIIALALGAIMWSLVQQAMDLGFSWQESITIHMMSNITKYIPGYAWQYLSKAYWSKKRGNPTKSTTLAILTEFALLVTGGIVVAAGWGFLGHQTWQWNIPLWAWSIAGGVGLLTSIGWNLAIFRLAKIEKQPNSHTSHLWYALGTGMIGWVMFALATWLMSRSIYPVTLKSFPQHAVALVASVIVGILIVIIPGGLGVREVSLALLLTGVLPFTISLVVGVMIRFSVIFWELIGFGIAFQLDKIHNTQHLSNI